MTKNSNLKIGVSLTPLYLSSHADDVDHQWFGPVDSFLQELSDAGATHIELRAITPATPLEVAQKALDKVWDAGLRATVHGTLPPLCADDSWVQTHKPLITLLEQITRGDPDHLCPVALHSFASKDLSADQAQLAEKSVASLIHVANWLEKNQISAQLELEINRSKKQIDPSTSYEGVLDMQQKVNHRLVKICWDMGHTWSNVQNGFMEQTPPPGFAGAVGHTHIHDLGPTGITHWPLTEKRLPLEWFVKRLTEQNYSGVWNLEFEPKRYSSEPQIKQRIIKSVGRIINTVADAASS